MKNTQREVKEYRGRRKKKNGKLSEAKRKLREEKGMKEKNGVLVNEKHKGIT